MGRLYKLLTSVLMTMTVAGVAHAAPTIDSLTVQGYMKKANGTSVTDGAYTLAFGVFQNSVPLWGRSYSVQVTNGLFSRTLSGVGGDLSALPAGTGMNSDFSATGSNVTLSAAVLLAGGATGITIRVYAVSLIDATNPQFDITLAAAPTAMICEISKGVAAGSVTLAGLAASATAATSAGAGDVGKLATLDATGKFDDTFIPDLAASIITSGQVAVGNGGTGSTDGSITGTTNITYMSAAGSTTNIGNTAGASVLSLRSGTGGIAAAVTGATGDVSFTAGSTSGNIVLTPGTTSGTVTVGSASGGAASFGNTGAGAVSTFQGGSGMAGQAVLTSQGTSAGAVTVNAAGGAAGTLLLTSAGTGADAVNLTATGVGGGITLTPEPTGNLTAGGGTTSGTITIGNASTGASLFGNTGAASTTTLRGGSGAAGQVAVTSAGTAATAVNIVTTGVGGGVTIAPEATGNFIAGGGSTSGSVTIGNASTGNTTFGNTGAASLTTVRGGSGTGSVLLTTAGTGNGSDAVSLNVTGSGGGISITPGNQAATTLNGNVRFPVATVTLANGVNNDIVIGNGHYFRVAGPTQGFSLTGMTGGVDGRMVTVENGIAKPMLIATNTTSSAANQIQGEGCVLTQYGTASFVYNGTLAKWVQTSCNVGSAALKTFALVAATTYNSGAPLVTDGAKVLRVAMTGNFAATVSCIALDTNNSLTPYVGQTLTVVWNFAPGGGAASNWSTTHNTVCAAPGFTVRTSTAATVAGTAAANGIITTYVFEGTYWVLQSILL